MATVTKNTQGQYKQVPVAGKTITTVEVFQRGSQTIVEVICSDGTTQWVTENQGVLTVTSTQPY